MPAARLAMTATVAHQDVHASLSGVTRIYPAAAGTQAVHALGPVDLDLKRGEFFAVVGPSGCGKSTLLEVLAGLQQPTAGTVTFEGHSVAGVVPDGIGVVFQEDASFPWLTVWDNAAFGLRRAGVSEAEVRRHVDDALAFMGLKDFARAYPPQLSGGMRQRVIHALLNEQAHWQYRCRGRAGGRLPDRPHRPAHCGAALRDGDLASGYSRFRRHQRRHRTNSGHHYGRGRVIGRLRLCRGC